MLVDVVHEISQRMRPTRSPWSIPPGVQRPRIPVEQFVLDGIDRGGPVGGECEQAQRRNNSRRRPTQRGKWLSRATTSQRHLWRVKRQWHRWFPEYSMRRRKLLVVLAD
jgi:hypothetical protein